MGIQKEMHTFKYRYEPLTRPKQNSSTKDRFDFV